MPTGKVKWFNNAKGYGFILPDEGEGDLFAHFSAIQMDGYKTLKAGQPVAFDTIQGPKGLHAINITDVEGEDIVHREPVDAMPDGIDESTVPASDASADTDDVH